MSVVIPCYNAAAYLAQALESVLAQTRPVTEVLVVDDGSTDGSPEIAARYPVTLLRTERNGGPFVARNLALRVARGDVVASLDADDWWLPHHCERVVALLERFPEAGAAGAAVRLSGEREGVFLPRFVPDAPIDVFWTALRASPLPHMSSMVRRALLLEVGGYDDRLRASGDFDLWLRLARRAPFVCTHEVTACYRWHGDQISRRPLAQLEAVYRSRRGMYDALVAEGDAATAGRVAGVMREIWSEQLREAWQARDFERLQLVIALGREVPGASRAEALRWRALARTRGLVLGAWNALPAGARAGLKRVLGLRRAVVRPPDPGRTPWQGR